ncbi:hypothetical protein [Lysinibacillus capsici]|uniref:hypothetical protein n=1 Tax=Lysinibacillus capsici TaxID=2115968 RepID=UPI003081F526|nr:hypothetical protein ICJ70_21745 [Lysinibacillus capsici]
MTDVDVSCKMFDKSNNKGGMVVGKKNEINQVNIEVKIAELELELVKLKIEQVAEEAFLQGVEYGKQQHKWPPLLTNSDLKEIFQCSRSVVHRLKNLSGFPNFSYIQGRYPRDEVFKWIKNNSI